MAGPLNPLQIEALRQRLVELISAGNAPDLAEAALLIAAEHNPGLDSAAGLRQLDTWARKAAPSLAAARTPQEQARALIAIVHEELGFEGNSVNYYDPANSYFDQVLERRVGIPITLALVYIALGRRAGVDVQGVGFPGHFLVTVGAEPPLAILDPFSGKILTAQECQERLTAALGPAAKLGPEYLTAATPREFIVRMLRNLKHIFLERATQSDASEAAAAEADRSALACCDRILLLLPEDPTELRDRGFVHGRLGHAVEACADLERALELAPQAPWAKAVRDGLPALKSLAGPLN